MITCKYLSRDEVSSFDTKSGIRVMSDVSDLTRTRTTARTSATYYDSSRSFVMSALSRLPNFIPKLPFAAYRRLHSEAPRLSKFVQVSKEVQDALSSGTPVVALETAIYTHGRRPTMSLAHIQLTSSQDFRFRKTSSLPLKLRELSETTELPQPPSEYSTESPVLA